MPRYSKFQDAVNAVMTALGDEADHYDVQAIVSEAFEYRADRDEQGRIRLDTGGLVQIVTDDRFWAIVASHEKR